jgi:hypothetical protein
VVTSELSVANERRGIRCDVGREQHIGPNGRRCDIYEMDVVVNLDTVRMRKDIVKVEVWFLSHESSPFLKRS